MNVLFWLEKKQNLNEIIFNRRNMFFYWYANLFSCLIVSIKNHTRCWNVITENCVVKKITIDDLWLELYHHLYKSWLFKLLSENTPI